MTPYSLLCDRYDPYYSIGAGQSSLGAFEPITPASIYNFICLRVGYLFIAFSRYAKWVFVSLGACKTQPLYIQRDIQHKSHYTNPLHVLARPARAAGWRGPEL